MEAKKYSVIYADPPWQTKAGRPLSGYKMENGKQLFIPTSNTSRELAYNTMTVEEICAMPIQDVATDNCHLYLWVTNQYLMRAGEVIKAWGFKYSTTLVWAKNPMGGGLGRQFWHHDRVFAIRDKRKPQIERKTCGHLVQC